MRQGIRFSTQQARNRGNGNGGQVRNPRSRGHRKADVMRSKAQQAQGHWD